MIIVSRKKNTQMAEFKRFNTARKVARRVRQLPKVSALRAVGEWRQSFLNVSRGSLESELGLASAPVRASESALGLSWAAGSESAPRSALAVERRRAHLQ